MGLLAGMNLDGMVFDGTGPPLVIDLPGANTLDGFNAISVWCASAGANFGSGTFVVPEPATFWMLMLAGLGLFGRRRTKYLSRAFG